MVWFCVKIKVFLQLVLILNITTGSAKNVSKYSERKIAWEKLEDEIEQLCTPDGFVYVCITKITNIQSNEVAFPNASISLQGINGKRGNIEINVI